MCVRGLTIITILGGIGYLKNEILSTFKKE